MALASAGSGIRRVCSALDVLSATRWRISNPVLAVVQVRRAHTHTIPPAPAVVLVPPYPCAPGLQSHMD